MSTNETSKERKVEVFFSRKNMGKEAYINQPNKDVGLQNGNFFASVSPLKEKLLGEEIARQLRVNEGGNNIEATQDVGVKETKTSSLEQSIKKEVVIQPFNTEDEKKDAVAKAIYIEEFIEECLPRIGTVLDEQGAHNPAELKEILHKVYTKKIPIENVPLTFGMREKVVELMEKAGLRPLVESELSVKEGSEEGQLPLVVENVEEEMQKRGWKTDPFSNKGGEKEEKKGEENIEEISNTEIWKDARKRYREYRERVKVAEALYIEKSESYEKERQETGFFSRLMATPKLDTAKEEMLKAQSAYDVLLEGLRDKRQKRMEYFIQKQQEKGVDETEENAQKTVAYIARHEALLERHIDNEVQILERLRYQENEKGESRYRLLRGIKAGWNWYRTLSLKKRLMVGAGIGAVVGGALGASGVVAGGAFVAGGAMAARRAIGGFFGSILALETKRKGDSFVSFLGKKALKKQHESFSYKGIGESRRERLAIKKNVRLGKHVATVGAGAAAVMVGAGVSNVSHAVVDAFGVPDAHADLLTTPEEKISIPESNPSSDRVLTQEVFKENSSTQPTLISDEYRARSHEEVMFGGDDAKISTEATTPVPEEKITIKGEYEKGSSVEKELIQFLKYNEWIAREYPGLTDVERLKIAHLMRMEFMKDPVIAEKFNIQGGDWNKVLRDGKYEITINRDFIDAEIQKIHHPVSARDIQDILRENGIGEDTQTIRESIPEKVEKQHIETRVEASPREGVSKETVLVVEKDSVEVKGVYEKGSSVEKEFAQFLKENAWVKNKHPHLTDTERGKIAGLIRTELMKDPAMAEKLKIHGNDWSKVGINDTYAINLSKSFIEEQIEKVHRRAPVAPPDEGRMGVVKEPENKIEVQPEVKSKMTLQEYEENRRREQVQRMEEIDRSHRPVAKKVEKLPEIKTQPEAKVVQESVEKESVPVKTEKELSLNKDLERAEKSMGAQKVDYRGVFSRPAIEGFFRDGIFNKMLHAQRPVVLSNWGPISHVRMQDIFDGNKSLSYTIGDSTVTMGAQAERFTRSIVTQLERGLHKKIPDIEKIVEKAKINNIRLGDLVNELSEKIKTQHTSITSEQSIKTQSGTVLETSSVVYERPTVDVLNEAEGTYMAKLKPVKINEMVNKIVYKKYLFAHPNWSMGGAEELYRRDADFKEIINLYQKEIALDLNYGKELDVSKITIDLSAYKNMTPADLLRQLEQHHRTLSKENTPLPNGKVISRNVITSQ